MDERRAEDARLVGASRAGDPSAFASLFDHWFDRCVDVSWRILHDRDAAADVAQDAFLAAWQGLGGLRDPASFGGWVLRTTRNRSLDRLARDRRSVVIGDDGLAAAVDHDPRTDETAAVVTRAEGADLVWAASAALGERDASILDLHLRHELAAPEIAEALGVTPNNAHQLLFRLRRKLRGAIRAWVLWRDGQPACEGLASALAAGGVTRFGADAVRITAGHVPDCGDCHSRQHLRLAPEALFAAVPLVAVPEVLRARAAGALAAQGVPAGAPGHTPSASGGPSAGPGDPAPGAAGASAPAPAGAGQVPAGMLAGEATPAAPAGAAPRDRDGDARRRRRPLVLVGLLVLVAGSAVAVAGQAATGPERQAVEGAGGEDGDGTSAPAEAASTHAGAAATPAAVTGGGPDAEGGGAEGGGAEGGGAEGGGTDSGAPAGNPASAPAGDLAGRGTATDPGAADAGLPPEGTPVPGEGAGADGSTPPAGSRDLGVPSPASSTTTSTTTTTTTAPARPERVAAPPGAPQVLRFTAAAQATTSSVCPGGTRPVALTWDTAGATSVALRGPGAPTTAQPPAGSATACTDGTQRPSYTLTASGPGGTASATASA
jgi:RNA polymerase sigma factor (sigma-70 family)